MQEHQFQFWGINSRWRLLEQGQLAQIKESSFLKHVQVLRLSLDFDHCDELESSLKILDDVLSKLSPKVCLLQVRYKLETLTSKARQIHESFLKKHPLVSSYLPLCLPPSPLGEQVAWTRPHDCASCLFFEAQRCGGLRGDEKALTLAQQQVTLAGGALRSSWSLPLQKDEFSTSPPACYWWPENRLVSRLQKLITSHHCQSLWDIGGANGFVAWWFRSQFPSLKQAYCIDPIADQYPSQEGVYSCSITAEQALQHTQIGKWQKPDMLVISWPSPGLLFTNEIKQLQPKIIIRVTDHEGVCGVRKGHRSLMISGRHAQLFGLAEAFADDLSERDELEPPEGYRLVDQDRLWCFRDFQTQAHNPSALWRVFEKVKSQ